MTSVSFSQLRHNPGRPVAKRHSISGTQNWPSSARERNKKWDNTPEDELRHDVTDELAAYKLAQLPFPGVFGVFYQNERPTKNALEKKWIETTREKTGNLSDVETLQKTFDRMK